MNVKSIRKMAYRLKIDYESNIKLRSLTGQIEELIEHNSEDSIQHGIEQIAEEVLNEAYYTVDIYKTLRSEVRKKKIWISEIDKKDIPDYKSFRKGNMGKLNISSMGRPVDIVYGELNEEYPEMFSKDITHPADQLMEIDRVVKNVAAPVRVPVYFGLELEEIKEDIVQNIKQQLENSSKGTEEFMGAPVM